MEAFFPDPAGDSSLTFPIPTIDNTQAFDFVFTYMTLQVRSCEPFVIVESSLLLLLCADQARHILEQYQAMAGVNEPARWVINGVDFDEAFLGPQRLFPDRHCTVLDYLAYPAYLKPNELHDAGLIAPIMHASGSFFVPEHAYEHNGMADMPSPHLFPDPSATLPRSPATSASPTSPPTAAGKAKIKRPPNAFILYRQHWHPIVVARNPNAHNNQISRIIGTMWQQSSDDEREPFRLLAVEKKAEKLRAHPDYRYQPRKSSEKRRRMTKNKVAALRAQAIGIHTSAIPTDTTSANAMSPTDSVDSDVYSSNLLDGVLHLTGDDGFSVPEGFFSVDDPAFDGITNQVTDEDIFDAAQVFATNVADSTVYEDVFDTFQGFVTESAVCKDVFDTAQGSVAESTVYEDVFDAAQGFATDVAESDVYENTTVVESGEEVEGDEKFEGEHDVLAGF